MWSDFQGGETLFLQHVIFWVRIFHILASHLAPPTIWNQNWTTTSFKLHLSLSFLPLVSVLVGFSWFFRNPGFSEENIPGVGFLLRTYHPLSAVHWWSYPQIPEVFGAESRERERDTWSKCYATESALAGMADATECIGCVHEEACSMLRNVFIACTETSSFLQNAWSLCTYWEHARCYAMWVVE